jgi:hypothetical protein
MGQSSENPVVFKCSGIIVQLAGLAPLIQNHPHKTWGENALPSLSETLKLASYPPGIGKYTSSSEAPASE